MPHNLYAVQLGICTYYMYDNNLCTGTARERNLSSRVSADATAAAARNVRLTLHENYLLLFLHDGRMFWLGELDIGFSAAEAKLRERFATFDPNRMTALETDPPGARHPVWDREQGRTSASPRSIRLSKRLWRRRGPSRIC